MLLQPRRQDGQAGVTMGLKTEIEGMVWPYPDTFVVEREQIREFAAAVKALDRASFYEPAARELGYPTLIAPLTFAAKFALLIQQHFFRHVDLGIDAKPIFHVDQAFRYHRPLISGDTLRGTLYIESVKDRFDMTIVTTRSACTDKNEKPVLETLTTLMVHNGDPSIDLKRDPQTGQYRRAPDAS